MKDSNLSQLLKKFSSREMSELEKFLRSPFFKSKRDVLPLYKVVRKYYPEFDSDDFTSEKIYAELFPGKQFDTKADGLLRTITSEFLVQCKEFLAFSQFSKDTNKKRIYLLNQLRSKKAFKEFEREVRGFSVNVNESETDLTTAMLDNMMLSSVVKNFSLDKDKFREAFESSLKSREYSVVVALINSFMHQDEKTLAFGYNISLRNNLIDDLLENVDLESLMKKIENSSHELYPFVYTFYLVYRMNKEGRKELYVELRDHLEKYIQLFPGNDRYVLLSILGTFCSFRTAGEERDLFRKELFFVHKKMIEANAYKISDKHSFHIVLFRNIVLNCWRIGETQWLGKFIEEYSKELHADHRESMTHYSKAHLLFAEEKFDEALTHIMKIKYDLFLYKMDLKYLQLQTYYELNYFEQAYSLIDASMHFIKNSATMHDRAKTTANNFFKYTKELLKIKEQHKTSSNEAGYLKKKLMNEKLMANSEWMLKKIENVKRQT